MNFVISGIFAYIIEAFIAFYFFHNIFSAKKTKGKILFIYAISYTIQFLLFLIHNLVLNNFVFLFGNLAIILLCYESSFLTAFLYSIILNVLMTCSELIVLLIPHDFYKNYPLPDLTLPIQLVCFIASKTFYLILAIVLVNIIQKKQKVAVFKLSPPLVAIVTITLFLICMLTAIILRTPLDNVSETLLSSCFVLILIINILAFGLQKYIQETQQQAYQLKLKLQQELATKNYEALASTQDQNQRIFIHDIKNHLQYINKLCSDENNEAAVTYINQLIESRELSNSINYSNNNSLNIILNLYYPRFKNEGIRFSINAANCNIDFIESTDITTMFSNILDNAYRSASCCAEKYIDITIKQLENSDIVRITASNPCISSPQFDEDGRPVTTKQDKHLHGLGLKSIEQIAEKYNGFVDYRYDEEICAFKLAIMLTSNLKLED